MGPKLHDAMKNTCENLRSIFNLNTLEGHKRENRSKSLEHVDSKGSPHTKQEKADKTHTSQAKNFWLNMRSPVTVLSYEVSKLSLLLAKQPLPSASDVEHILDMIEALALEIVTTSRHMPVSEGRCLRTRLLGSVENLGHCLAKFFTFPHEENFLISWTECVWTACETIVKLPNNNLEAVIKILSDEEGLLADAIQDIEDEIKADRFARLLEEEVDNTATWTNQDRELLFPCVRLVQTARATIKQIGKVLKSQGKCESAENIAQLDAIADAAQLLSPAVEEVVSAIYPPVTKSVVSSAALKVVTVIRQILELYQNSHFAAEADETWLSFLLRAIDHNNNKVQPLLSPN